MTAGEARERAAGLIAMAEHIELVNGPKHAPAPEAEPEPAKPKGRLAEMLGVAAPIAFTEERPGVWKTATPEDGERLDASIDEALASLGTSLAELRESEAFTLCRTCGSLAHEREACTAEGLAPGEYWRAWKRHVGHLPGDTDRCADAGHCGHAPCCNCSGIMPDPDTYARLTAEILAKGRGAL
jgi:hypothetical protein